MLKAMLGLTMLAAESQQVIWLRCLKLAAGGAAARAEARRAGQSAPACEAHIGRAANVLHIAACAASRVRGSRAVSRPAKRSAQVVLFDPATSHESLPAGRCRCAHVG
jgi:hypothetical protein